MGPDGVCAAMTVAAGTSTAVFLAKPHRGLRRAFVTPVLIPTLARDRPDAAVVMDPRQPLRDFADLAAHKAALVRRAFEQAWSKMKAHLRAKAAQARDALEHAIPHALATTTPSNA